MLEPVPGGASHVMLVLEKDLKFLQYWVAWTKTPTKLMSFPKLSPVIVISPPSVLDTGVTNEIIGPKKCY
jgi:hypothetical protein